MQKVIALDLEGVLIPEIWQLFAQKTEIKELLLTTRDIPNYDELMNYRLNILKENNLNIHDIQKVLEQINPLDGALNFIREIRKKAELIILSDTFIEFFDPLREKLEYPTIFCNHLDVDPTNGTILSHVMRVQDGKKKTVQALQQINCIVAAAGDSYNDLSMLQQANYGAWFKPPQKIIAEYPDIPVFVDYKTLQGALFTALELNS